MYSKQVFKQRIFVYFIISSYAQINNKKYALTFEWIYFQGFMILIIYQSFCLSIYVSNYLSIYLSRIFVIHTGTNKISIHLSIFLSTNLSIYQSIYQSMRIFYDLQGNNKIFVHLLMFLSINLISIYLSRIFMIHNGINTTLIIHQAHSFLTGIDKF